LNFSRKFFNEKYTKQPINEILSRIFNDIKRKQGIAFAGGNSKISF